MKKKKLKIGNRTKAIGIVVGFVLLALIVVPTVKAEWNFWAGVKHEVATMIYGSITDTPDFSIPDEETFTAMASPYQYSKMFCQNDICIEPTTIALKTAATSSCAIQSPTHASSTLLSYSYAQNKDKATGTATMLHFGRTSTTTSEYWDYKTAFATTSGFTKIREAMAVAASDQVMHVNATSSPVTFAPGEWFVIARGGTVESEGGVLEPVYNSGTTDLGYCQATFRVIKDH